MGNNLDIGSSSISTLSFTVHYFTGSSAWSFFISQLLWAGFALLADRMPIFSFYNSSLLFLTLDNLLMIIFGILISIITSQFSNFLNSQKSKNFSEYLGNNTLSVFVVFLLILINIGGYISKIFLGRLFLTFDLLPILLTSFIAMVLGFIWFTLCGNVKFAPFSFIFGSSKPKKFKINKSMDDDITSVKNYDYDVLSGVEYDKIEMEMESSDKPSKSVLIDSDDEKKEKDSLIEKKKKIIKKRQTNQLFSTDSISIFLIWFILHTTILSGNVLRLIVPNIQEIWIVLTSFLFTIPVLFALNVLIDSSKGIFSIIGLKSKN